MFKKKELAPIGVRTQERSHVTCAISMNGPTYEILGITVPSTGKWRLISINNIYFAVPETKVYP